MAGHMRAGPVPPNGHSRPEGRGCWKPRQRSENTPSMEEKMPEEPVVPAEPQPVTQTTQPGASASPRQLQSSDSSATSSNAATPAEPQVGQSSPSSVGSAGPTTQTRPARGPHGWGMGHHWGRHHPRHWGRHGPRHWGRHGPTRWAGKGFRHWGKHHRRRHVFKAVFFFLVVPLIMLLCFRCAKKRVARRVRQLLEIENRRFREKYGCEWNTNKHVSKLTLRRLAFPQQAPLGYPVQPVYPTHPERTPFCQQGEQAPLFTEAAPAQHHHHTHGGYQRVSLDDSTVVYQ